jgi:DNA-binding response OmpR family regulator
MMTKAHLLVVDDEATIRNFLVRVLEREGYIVTSAGDGLEALEILSQAQIDLMLSDIRMDQLDGVDLLKQARSAYPDLAVLLLTGHATVDSAVAALRHGALNYLLKPVKNEEIVEAVHLALEERAHQQRRKQLEQLATQFSTVISGGAVAVADVDEAANRPTYLICGGIELDLAGYTALKDGERLNLTPTEFRLLAKFVQTPGVVFDYVELVRDACGYTCARHEAQEIINTHIRNLRHKLGIEPDQPLYIESVRSMGYRLLEPGA